MGHEAQETDAAAAVDFKEVQSTERFQELRKRHRSFVFPMAIAFLLWYFAYVLLADYAVGFMSTKVWGQYQRWPDHGPAPVRDHVRHHRLVRQLLEPQDRPHRLRNPPRNRRA